jgi:hypothetical protein
VPVSSRRHLCLQRGEQAGSLRDISGWKPKLLCCALLEQFVVKKSRRFKFDEVRQRFRLTPTEKRVAVFVAAAFALGLTTKCYRDAHPSPAPIQTHSGKSPVSRSSSTNVDQAGALNVRETATGTRRSAKKLNLPDSPAEQQYQRK